MINLSSQVWGGGLPLSESLNEKQTHPWSISEWYKHQEDTPCWWLFFVPTGKIRLHLAQQQFPRSQSQSHGSVSVGAGSSWVWGSQPTSRGLPGPHTLSHPLLLYLTQQQRTVGGKGLLKYRIPPRSIKQQARGCTGNVIVDGNQRGLPDTIHLTLGPDGKMMGTWSQEIQVKAKPTTESIHIYSLMMSNSQNPLFCRRDPFQCQVTARGGKVQGD